jgi:uncharacterized RDD family membrane protein YckC
MQVPVQATGWFNLDNVRTLRVVAFGIDFIVVFALYVLLTIVLGIAAFPTFGATLLLWPALQFTGLIYAGLTIGGRGQGTWGMRAVGLKVTDIYGNRVGFIQGAAHATLFWLSAGWLTWLLLMVAFFNPYKRALHDFLTGIVISRRNTE